MVRRDWENERDRRLLCERAVREVRDTYNRRIHGAGLLQQLHDLDASPAAREHDQERVGRDVCGVEQFRSVKQIDRPAGRVKVQRRAERRVVACADTGEINVPSATHRCGDGHERTFAAKQLNDTSQLIRLAKYVLKEMRHVLSSIHAAVESRDATPRDRTTGRRSDRARGRA